MTSIVTSHLWWPYFIGSAFITTLLADAVLVPRGARGFLWRHWWHWSLLLLSDIGVWTLLAVAQGGGTYSAIVTKQGISTIVTIVLVTALWLQLAFGFRSRVLWGKRDIILGAALVICQLAAGCALFSDPLAQLVWTSVFASVGMAGLLLLLSGIVLLCAGRGAETDLVRLKLALRLGKKSSFLNLSANALLALGAAIAVPNLVVVIAIWWPGESGLRSFLLSIPPAMYWTCLLVGFALNFAGLPFKVALELIKNSEMPEAKQASPSAPSPPLSSGPR